ncbi:MAG: sodium transporter permease [Rhizobacter sp.]|nr:sodium transporter permease [Rhizobacter sp.]
MTALGHWRAAFAVYRKEIVDALRDRRTLLVVLMSSVLLGPLVLVALSSLVANLEAQAERREVFAVGLAGAPTLVNFIARQSYVVREAPADYEAMLRSRSLADPVLVVPPDFEAALRRGDAPGVEVVSDSGNRQAEAGANRLLRLLDGFGRERAVLAIALRGVSPALMSPMRVQERDLANDQSRAAQFTAMLPFFVIMAVLYGALNAGLDTTAGERERGSLEPLLMTPVERLALVFGKWGAVASVGMLVAVLSSFSFLPAQWLLRSDTLQALFRFGPSEALAFLALLLPFAAALSALLMAIAIRCKTFKEAQATTGLLVLFVSLMPLLTVLNPTGERPWHLWVPALAQHTLMTRVLKGESLGTTDWAIPLAVCVVLTAICLGSVARSMKVVTARG